MLLFVILGIASVVHIVHIGIAVFQLTTTTAAIRITAWAPPGASRSLAIN